MAQCPVCPFVPSPPLANFLSGTAQALFAKSGFRINNKIEFLEFSFWFTRKKKRGVDHILKGLRGVHWPAYAVGDYVENSALRSADDIYLTYVPSPSNAASDAAMACSNLTFYQCDCLM